MNDLNQLNPMHDNSRQRAPGAWRIPRWALFAGIALLIGIALLLIPPVSATSWLSFLPFLFLLACPLMMIFMMGSMNHGHDMESSRSATRHAGEDPLDLTGLAPEDQVRALRSELTRMNWQQEALREELERLEATHEVATRP